MESVDYLQNIMNEHLLDKEDLIDILNYLSYIARDNNESEADGFLGELMEYLED
mgnify:CR=1 FL=1